MSSGDPPFDPPPNLSAAWSGDWQLDAEPVEEAVEEPAPPAPAPEPLPVPPSLFPSVVSIQSETPPSPEQLVEAMLFVGGHPLAVETATAAIRGLTAERFTQAIETLTRRYRRQRRPYTILPRDGGFVLALLPAYLGLRERLFGGPREARLGQAAVDVLSVVAYRQPIGKGEIDAIRGSDSASILRQLVRLGLVAVQHRAESGTREVRYGTTPRFLELFGLASLDELPRLGDTTQI
jgi:segregation and condensation protein B